MNILVNHLGYDADGPKRAVLQYTGSSGSAPLPQGAEPAWHIVRAGDGAPILSGRASPLLAVPGWRGRTFRTLAFDALRAPGRYRLVVRDGSERYESMPFETGRGFLLRETFSDLLYYFKGQRSGGEEDLHDRSAGFFGGRPDRVDLRGGWYDASGDTSKYLSHLSYTNYLNPQQTPAVVWAMLESLHVLRGRPSAVEVLPELWERRLREEAAWGADFLVRMQDPEGYFYMTLFDRWSKNLDERMISTFRTQQGFRGDDYQAGWRQGGGMAIAALARAAAEGLRGEFDAQQYLQAAQRAFRHLLEHGRRYLDDGRENIIDSYCALLAATELAAATGDPAYTEAARGRCTELSSCFRSCTGEEGRAGALDTAAFWSADFEGTRPYYHAAEAGLPVLALLRYASTERDAERAASARRTALAALGHELAISCETDNPFGYARQTIPAQGGGMRSAFFIPHENESGYWWQGENARLASLAAAALRGTDIAAGDDAAALRRYGADQINWILGLNPFDVCMMEGKGRNNPEYLTAFPNAPGGICNGITGGFHDEKDIAFLPEPQASSPLHRWRWSEQWIPHAGWFLLAVALAAPAERGDE